MPRKNEELIYENPVIVAVAVFLTALIINDLLETQAAATFFDSAGQLFNTGLEKFNSVTAMAFGNHPYFKIPPVQNPITLEDIERARPWMWLRGYMAASFIISILLTWHLMTKINFRKIFAISFYVCLYTLGYFVFVGAESFNIPYLLPRLTDTLPGLFPCLIACVLSFLFGTTFSLYSLKAIINLKYKDQPDVFLKLMAEND